MREKRYRFLSFLLVFVMVFTTILPFDVGQVVVKADTTEPVDVELKDGDFTGDFWNDGIWNVKPSTWDNATFEKLVYADDEHLTPGEQQGETGFHFWMGDSGTFTLTQVVETLPAGNYNLLSYIMGTDAEVQIIVQDQSGNLKELEGYNTWSELNASFQIKEPVENAVIGFNVSVSAGGNGYLDCLKLTYTPLDEEGGASDSEITSDQLSALIAKVPANYETTGFQSDTVSALRTALEAAQGILDGTASEDIVQAYNNLQAALNGLVYEDPTIQIEKVNGLNERADFIKGVDISSYLSETASGVVYKNQDGQAVSGKEFIKTFAEVGINYIRLRVWNAPYDLDSSGNKLYYGGGNNDMETTLSICQMIKDYNDTYAAAYGEVKVLIDLQYSDFWADPDKQTAPKAWKDMDITAKTAAVKEFTKDCLAQVEAAGVTIGMVQVGNETNTGICGTKYGTEDYYAVFRAGCEAVQEYNNEKGYMTDDGSWIKRVVHFTDPHTASTTFAKSLKDNGVDYDVYATSYYPFWHGTPTQLNQMLADIARTCGCEVMVAETQYVYTNEDYDGADNQAYEGKENINLTQWPVSVQGQAKEIRDVINAVASVGEAGIGMFYWEPGWLGVGNAYDADGKLSETALAANRQKWNTYGSGWASDYAKTYDEQAEKWGGWRNK